MRKVIILFFAVLCFAQLSYGQHEDQRLAGVDKEMNAIIDSFKTAGFSVAVVDKDGLIYAKGFGYADLENKIKATENTHYAIGSCTKAFTSAVLGKLRADEKLSFDDSPIKHIPELKFYNDELNANITVKDLMCHRTGIPRHDFSWYLFPTHSKDSLLARIEYQEPFTDLRKQWYYNNFMFLTQGVISERITGKSWEDNIVDMFFKPLGMDESSVVIAGLKDGKNAAVGYQLNADDEIEKMEYYDIAAMGAAGSINSSVVEMSKWVQMWINGGVYNSEEILPSNYINEAIGSQMIIGSALPDADMPDIHFATYGYGWMMASYKGHYRVEHGGNIDGFSASTAFFPSDSIGIIVLTNQNGSQLNAAVRNIMADRMLEVERTPWTKNISERIRKNKKQQKEAEENVVSNQVVGTNPSHILPEYAGVYSHPGYGDFKITAQNDSLFMDLRKMKLWLAHYHYDVFKPYEVENGKIDTSDNSPLRISFTTGTSGEITGAIAPFEAMLDPLEFKRTPAEVEVASADLEKYTGDYEVMGTTIKVYVKKEKLYLFVAGQPEYEQIATGEHKFSSKILDGFKLEFNEGEGGAIESVTLIQPNGTFVANRKAEE